MSTANKITKLEYAPATSIIRAIEINKNLKVETFLYHQSIIVSFLNLKTPFIASCFDEMESLLDKIDDMMFLTRVLTFLSELEL